MPLPGGRLILEDQAEQEMHVAAVGSLQASWVDRLSALGASTICVLGYSL